MLHLNGLAIVFVYQLSSLHDVVVAPCLLLQLGCVSQAYAQNTPTFSFGKSPRQRKQEDAPSIVLCIHSVSACDAGPASSNHPGNERSTLSRLLTTRSMLLNLRRPGPRGSGANLVAITRWYRRCSTALPCALHETMSGVDGHYARSGVVITATGPLSDA
jgi:hypothetical protein